MVAATSDGVMIIIVHTGYRITHSSPTTALVSSAVRLTDIKQAFTPQGTLEG